MTLVSGSTIRSGLRRMRSRIDLSRSAKAVRRGLADVLFPPNCVSCGVPFDEESASRDVLICDACLESMEIFSGPVCVRCGAPVPDLELKLGEGCYRCAGRKIW